MEILCVIRILCVHMKFLSNELSFYKFEDNILKTYRNQVEILTIVILLKYRTFCWHLYNTCSYVTYYVKCLSVKDKFTILASQY